MSEALALVSNNLPVPSALGSLEAYISATHRVPMLTQDEEQELAERLRDEYGVNTDKLKRVPQRPEQVGKLGYEVPNVR